MTQKRLTIAEAASRMGVHQNTVRTMIKNGKIAYTRTQGDTGNYRILESDVEAFMGTEDLTQVAPALILTKHLHRGQDQQDLDEWLPSLLAGSELGLFLHLLKAADPFVVFGSFLKHASEEQYSETLRGKANIWVHTAITNIMEIGIHKASISAIAQRLKIGIASVDLGGVQKPITTLLIFNGKNGSVVLDGTLQQFFAGLGPGLFLMDKEVAQNYYINLKELSLEEYAEATEDEHSVYFQEFMREVYESEFLEESDGMPE